MGSSRPDAITTVLQKVLLQPHPRTVLDVGAGHGKWGALLREYLDFWKGHLEREKWSVIIEAIEPFARYHASPLYGCYDYVIPDPVERLWLREEDQVVHASWDWIFMMEVLEHMPKAQGVETLEHLIPAAHKLFVLSTPIHVRHQGPVHGNPLEAHVSSWSQEELVEIFTLVGGIAPNVSERGNHYLVWWGRP